MILLKGAFIKVSCFLFRLANAINEILSVVLFFQLLVCAVSLAIFMVGLEKSYIFSMNFILALSGLAAIIASAYICCFLSDRMIRALSEIGDIFYAVAWYELPVVQQNPFILSIQRAQKEFRMTGLGFVECSLRVFSTVSPFSLRFCVISCFHPINWTYSTPNSLYSVLISIL